MRIFVPLNISDLANEIISPRLVHGVNQNLVDIYPNVDTEGLEYVATLAAADDSLRMLNSAGVMGLRRIVGVGEAPNSSLVLPASGEDILATGIYLKENFEIKRLESFLVDEPGSEKLVEKAVNGDEEAFLKTEEIELLWYDAIERNLLLRELDQH